MLPWPLDWRFSRSRSQRAVAFSDLRRGVVSRWRGKRGLPTLHLRNLVQHFTQCRANGLVRIGVVWVRRRTFSVEMGPLIHPSSPFHIGLADNFLQVMVRGENLLTVVCQSSERLIKVV